VKPEVEETLYMNQKPSQAQIDYTRRSYYVGIVAVIVAAVGIIVSYHIGKQSRAFPVEPNRLVSQETTPTPSPSPVFTPASVVPSPTPSPSPTPKVETGQRKPTRRGKAHQGKQVIGPCYLLNEDESYASDEEGNRIEVDCETGENIEP
jgi:hypothetical protein